MNIAVLCVKICLTFKGGYSVIEFDSEEDYLKCGLDFTDIFEKEIFRYLLKRDGKVIYSPGNSYICDVNLTPVFYVEQEYKII